MDKVLEYITKKGDGVISTREIAHALKISPEMVVARMERYAELGYIRRLVFSEGECGGKCRKCGGCKRGRLGDATVAFVRIQ